MCYHRNNFLQARKFRKLSSKITYFLLCLGIAEYRRLQPPWVVDSMDVVKQSDIYTITLNPLMCAANLPILSVWGSGQIKVTRVAAASPAVQGTFDLYWKGQQLTGKC